MSTLRKLRIVQHPSDEVATQPPVRWALDELRKSLTDHDVSIHCCENVGQWPPNEACIVISGRESASARAIFDASGVSVPDRAESLGIIPGKLDGRDVLLVCGSDVRGLVYAVLELADQVVHAQDVADVLAPGTPLVEEPVTPIRSIARLFTSDVEDKPWFYDRVFWSRYLSMLVAQRFNRFSLTLGLGMGGDFNLGDWQATGLDTHSRMAELDIAINPKDQSFAWSAPTDAGPTVPCDELLSLDYFGRPYPGSEVPVGPFTEGWSQVCRRLRLIPNR